MHNVNAILEKKFPAGGIFLSFFGEGFIISTRKGKKKAKIYYLVISIA